MAKQREPSATLRNRWVIAGLWLFLYGSFAVLSPPLLDGADALHAEMAREMIVRGDPVTLYASGIPLHDAPLLFWSMAGSMQAFGVGAPQARLPLAFSVLLLALLVEVFARRAFDSRRAGLYAAASLLLSPVLFFATRILTADAVSCLWLTAAVFCLWKAESARQERSGSAPVLPCMGFAAACAGNVLTVGTGGLLLPLATALLYLLLTRGARRAWRRIGDLHPVVSAAVFLMIALPWYALAVQANPGLSRVDRWVPWVLQGLPWVGTHFSPSPLLLLLGLLPWCVFLPSALCGVRWHVPLHAFTTEQQTLLLLAIAALLPIVLSPFATSRGSSALPSLPFLCMLVARWLHREAAEVEAMTVPARLGREGLRVSAFLLAAGTAAALLCMVLLLRSEPPSPQADLAALLRHAPDSGGYSLTLFLKAAAVGAFRGPVRIAGIALFGGALLNWQLRRSYRPHHGNITLAAVALVCLTEGHVALNTLAPVLSSQPLAAAVAPMLRPGNRIVINGPYDGAATMGFYLGRDNLHILQAAGERAVEPVLSDVSANFETSESLRKQWNGPERIFLWTDPAKLPALPTKTYIVAEGGGKQIVSNKAGPY